jgi:hypothetical protein
MKARPFVYDAHTQHPFILQREDDVDEVVQFLTARGISPDIRLPHHGVVRLEFPQIDPARLMQALHELEMEQSGVCENPQMNVET